jgi:thymidylate synthase
MVFFKDLKGDEKICSLNPINNEIEYIKPIENVKFDTIKPLYHVKSKYIDQLVSSGHSLYISKENRELFNLSPVDDIPYYRFRFKKNGIWKGNKEENFILPSIEYNNHRYNGYGEQRQIKMNIWLMFYGAWLADGSLRRYKDKNQYVVTITKQNKKEQDIFIKVFSKIFDNVRVYDKDILISDKQLYCYLEKFGKSRDKYIDRDFMNLSKEQLKILFYWMYRCDGTTRNCSYSTLSKQLADNVQELCLKIGYSSTLTKRVDNNIYINYIYKNDIFNMPHVLKDKNVKVIDNDKSCAVYCSRLPKNHILYVRRNGKACWSGNTYAERIGEQLPTVMETLLNTPNTNQTCIAIGRKEDVLINDPSCLREIDFKVVGDSLTLTTYWRSNDLWAGFPVNMGGMARLQEMVAEYIGKKVGKMYYYSSGSHIYEYQIDMIEAKIGRIIRYPE